MFILPRFAVLTPATVDRSFVVYCSLAGPYPRSPKMLSLVARSRRTMYKNAVMGYYEQNRQKCCIRFGAADLCVCVSAVFLCSIIRLAVHCVGNS